MDGGEAVSELPRGPGFFTRMILNWTSKSNQKELEKFVSSIAGASDEEMSELLLFVAFVRYGMEDNALHPLEPFNLVHFEKPDAATLMARQSQNFMRSKAIIPAAACTVWGHTFRAVLDGKLQPNAIRMWAELQRGAKHIEATSERVRQKLNINIAIDTAVQIPAGFSR
jgi:hypothetical protein